MQNGIGARQTIEDALAGRRVASVSGGGRLDLTLDGPVTVRVVHEFRFSAPSEVEHFYPELTVHPTGALLGLVGRTVDGARVTMAGGLELVFDGVGTLSVPPHALLAPWRVFTPEGAVCTGLPGGEVAWSEDGRTG
ncbi:DUF6188 family protein [Streptomyces sp. BE20]|uniref:DUF6188 family protein n=1 Tax=Streptomyces sp. BE20 TaxID=3002525 RepID=UPI002E7740FB|nr:DUF6188 family protein [Streptomyces sp. BE20]MEE1824255.1 DUF6188 family protein [Streptomyces sp. BE20]